MYRHLPSQFVSNAHHIVPQSWGGLTEPGNLVELCPNSHTAVHRLIDAYVRAGGQPPKAVLKPYNSYVRTLAARAWAGRPAKPTYTSLEHP